MNKFVVISQDRYKHLADKEREGMSRTNHLVTGGGSHSSQPTPPPGIPVYGGLNTNDNSIEQQKTGQAPEDSEDYDTEEEELTEKERSASANESDKNWASSWQSI